MSPTIKWGREGLANLLCGDIFWNIFKWIFRRKKFYFRRSGPFKKMKMSLHTGVGVGDGLTNGRVG